MESIEHRDNLTHRAKTSQLFKRIDLNLSRRDSRSSKESRVLNRSMSKLSMSKTTANFESYISKVRSAIKSDEASQTSSYLLSLRGQYDRINKDATKNSKSVELLKKDIDFIKQRVHKQNLELKKSEEKMSFLMGELAKISEKQEFVKMERKSLKHVIERMKNDQLILKEKSRRQEEIFTKLTKELRIKEDELLLCDGSIHKLVEQYNKEVEKYERDSDERNIKFKVYCEGMGELEEQDKFEEERKERMYELLSIESNDILDAKNVLLRDVLLANKVVDKMLDSKISDLLNSNQDLQNSYHLIKTEANISDPSDLTTKFFSYSENVENLTSKIRFYEQKLEHLTEENQTLREIEKLQTNKKLEEEKPNSENFEHFQEQKEKVVKECLEKELIIKKIKDCIDKITDAFHLGKNGQENYKIKMFEIYTFMTKESATVNVNKSKSQKYLFPGVRLKKMVKEVSLQDEKNRRSEMQEMNESIVSENEYITGERKKVKKNEFTIKTQPNKMTK